MIGKLTERRKGGKIVAAQSLRRNLDMPMGANVSCRQQLEQSYGLPSHMTLGRLLHVSKLLGSHKHVVICLQIAKGV